MQQFTYSYLNIPVTVKIDPVIIEANFGARKLQAQSNQITGFGLSYQPKQRNVFSKDTIQPGDFTPNDTREIQLHPQSSTQLVIAYQKDQKIKGLHIPINPKDPQALAMIEAMRATFPQKFIGIGPHFHMEKRLGISMFLPILVGVIIALVILGIILAYRFRHLLFNS